MSKQQSDSDVSSLSSESESQHQSQGSHKEQKSKKQQKERSQSRSTSSSKAESEEKSSKSNSRSRSRSADRQKKSKKEKKDQKQKKEKKEKQQQKEKKQQKEQQKDQKKHKANKEKKQDNCSSNSYGKFGVISIENYTDQQEEFHAWLTELQKENLETLSQRDLKRLFEDFAELYNTATLPDKKYYDLAIWHKKNKGMISGDRENVELDDQTSIRYSKQRRAKDLETAQVAYTLDLIRENEQILKDYSKQSIIIEQVKSDYIQGDVEEARQKHKQLYPNLPEKPKKLPTK